MEKINSGEFWEFLKEKNKEGILMNAGIKGNELWVDPDVPEEDSSLLPGHCYNILKVVEINGQKVINLRNPWGMFDWLYNLKDNKIVTKR